jgi:hypothetical protein
VLQRTDPFGVRVFTPYVLDWLRGRVIAHLRFNSATAYLDQKRTKNVCSVFTTTMKRSIDELRSRLLN